MRKGDFENAICIILHKNYKTINNEIETKKMEFFPESESESYCDLMDVIQEMQDSRQSRFGEWTVNDALMATLITDKRNGKIDDEDFSARLNMLKDNENLESKTDEERTDFFKMWFGNESDSVDNPPADIPNWDTEASGSESDTDSDSYSPSEDSDSDEVPPLGDEEIFVLNVMLNNLAQIVLNGQFYP